MHRLSRHFGTTLFVLSLNALAVADSQAPGKYEDLEARERYELDLVRDPATGKVPLHVRALELDFAARLPTQESLLELQLRKGRLSPEILAAGAGWSSFGPVNVGGRTRALALDATTQYLILAGGASGGMWRSRDNGKTWTKTTAASDIQNISCIVQDPRAGKGATWYYGTGERSGSTGIYGDGIFKSTDAGKTWSRLQQTKSSNPNAYDGAFDWVWNLAIDKSNTTEDELYAAVFGAIERSVDGGGNWRQVLGDTLVGQTSARGTYSDVAVTTTGVVYATLSSECPRNKGIWRSTNGTDWVDITPTGWPATYNRIVIAVAPSNEKLVYFLAETPGGGRNGHSFWKYTYVSGDGTGSGGAWEDRSAKLPALGGTNGTFTTLGSYCMVLKVKPTNPNVVFLGGKNLYRSVSAFADTVGTAWIGGFSASNTDNSFYANHHPDQQAIAFVPGDTLSLFSGHDGGVSFTSNSLAANVAWESRSTGYVTSQFYSVSVDRTHEGSQIVLGGTQDNGSLFTNKIGADASWKNLYGGDGSYCAIADDEKSYYISAQSGLTYRFLLDANGAMTDYARVDPKGGSGYLFINPFVLDPSDTKTMYMAGGKLLWRNSDLTKIPLRTASTSADSATAVNWKKLTVASAPDSAISAIGMSTSSPSRRLYYGTKNGKVFRLDRADLASDTTGTVDVWSSRGLPANANVQCISVDPENGDRALLIFSNYNAISIFYTSNAGGKWTNVEGNLAGSPGPSVRWATIAHAESLTKYLVGTSIGLYSTETLQADSTVWAQEGATTIGNVPIRMMDYRASDRILIAGTHGIGVYYTELRVPTSVVSGTSWPVALRLESANPCRPKDGVRFAYDIRQPAEVSVSVYDVRGRRVARLIGGEGKVGTHRFTWRGPELQRLNSSIYFLVLNVAGVPRSSQRLVLLK